MRLTLIGLADCLLHEGRLEEAVPVLRTLLPLHERYPAGIEATRADTARQLALCLEALGRDEELRPLRDAEGLTENE